MKVVRVHQLAMKLKRLRMYYNLTQADLAKKLSLTQGHISNMEVGRKIITFETCYMVEKKFKIPVEILRKATLNDFIKSMEENRVAI